MPDGQVENQNKCNERTVGAGLISRGASRFQIYMPAGQVDIFHVVSPCDDVWDVQYVACKRNIEMYISG